GLLNEWIRLLAACHRWVFFPLPLWERVDRMSDSSFETGEGSVSADRDPSSGALCAPPSPTRGEGRKDVAQRDHPPQRSQTEILHPGRSHLGFPDPESPLRRVLRQGWACPAGWRRDRRLCARSLGA